MEPVRREKCRGGVRRGDAGIDPERQSRPATGQAFDHRVDRPPGHDGIEIGDIDRFEGATAMRPSSTAAGSAERLSGVTIASTASPLALPGMDDQLSFEVDDRHDLHGFSLWPRLPPV